MLCKLIALALLSSLVLESRAAGVATVAIDFGSEWIKIGLVKPGVPMDIVLNRESKRKTANIVAIRNGERKFGNDALSTGVKYPKLAFRFLSELLGHKLDSPLVQQYQSMFPEHTLEADPKRGTVMFRVNEETIYTVEELVAMIIEHVLELSAEFAEQPITGVVLTVPPYFSQAQRKALRSAAELAGANVLQLINTHSAVGLNYGVFRRAEFTAEEQVLVFFDMGSFSTIATVVGYSTVKEKDSKTKNPQLQVKGIGFDRTLGGFSWDKLLQQYLISQFKANYAGKYEGDPEKNPRTMAKLLKEAERIKRVLSANTETYAQVEGLYQEVDFKTHVTRDTLEELAKDLYPRITKPLEDALKMANVRIEDTQQLILFGGAVRMPKVKAMLLEFNQNRELGQNINSDEAAALGGAYQAAALSKAFRVKKFLVKDANYYPIQVHFNRGSEDDEGNSYIKRVIKTVFDQGNVVPQKKVLTFNRFVDDFDFDVNYGDVSFLSEQDQKMLGSLNVSHHEVKNVAQAFESNSDATPKGVKAHFKLTEDGIAVVDRIDANFERMPEPEPVEEDEEKSTLEQLGDAIGNMFSSDDEPKDEEKDKEDVNEPAEGSDENANETQEESTEEKEQDTKDGSTEAENNSSNDEADSKAEESSEKDGEAPESTESTKNETTTEETKTDGNDTAPAEPKPITVKVPLVSDVEAKDVQELDADGRASIEQKLRAFKEAEEQKRRDEAAFNDLESYIFSTRDKMYDSEVESVSTAEERETVMNALNEASEWLDEDGWDAGEKLLTDKLDSLNATSKDIFYRLNEKQNRPAAVEKLKQSLNMTYHFVAHVKNVTANRTEDDPVWIKENELTDLEKLANETSEWLVTKEAAQQNTSLTETPVLKLSTLKTKTDKLDRELVFLLRRPQPKPKKPKKTKADNSTASSNSTEKAEPEKIVIPDDDEATTEGQGQGSSEGESDQQQTDINQDGSEAEQETQESEIPAPETGDAQPETSSESDDATEESEDAQPEKDEL